MKKLYAIFALFVITVVRNEVKGDLAFFKPITEECNNTFPVTQEVIFAKNLTKLSDTLKNDRNAKCFIHCLFHKLNFVDGKGNVKRKELFENANNVWSQIPEDKREMMVIPEMSPKMKTIVISFIDYCEAKDSVAQEPDACNKFFKFTLCLIDDMQAPGI